MQKGMWLSENRSREMPWQTQGLWACPVASILQVLLLDSVALYHHSVQVRPGYWFFGISLRVLVLRRLLEPELLQELVCLDVRWKVSLVPLITRSVGSFSALCIWRQKPFGQQWNGSSNNIKSLLFSLLNVVLQLKKGFNK